MCYRRAVTLFTHEIRLHLQKFQGGAFRLAVPPPDVALQTECQVHCPHGSIKRPTPRILYVVDPGPDHA